MISLRWVGAKVRIWQDRNFGADKVRGALQLCEEAGEVARAVGKEKDGIRPNTRGSVADELGDVIMAASAVADRYDIDLEEAVRQRVIRAIALDFVAWPDEGKSE